MKIFSIGVVFVMVLMLASCGGSAGQLDLQENLQPGDKAISATESEWVTAWNANRSLFHFQEISTWDETQTFGSLHTGGIFLVDRVGFTTAMALSMGQASLLTPLKTSVLGLWYDSLGDDLE